MKADDQTSDAQPKMTQRRLLGFLAFNCFFLFINFTVWSYYPSSPSVGEKEAQKLSLLPGEAAYEEYELPTTISQPGVLNIPRGARQEIVRGRNMRAKLENVELHGEGIQDEAARAWQEVRGNRGLARMPESDAYVTPKQPIRTEYSLKRFSRLREAYKVPKITYTNLVNCAAILNNDSREIEKAKQIVGTREHTKVPIFEEQYMDWTKNCAEFKNNRGYIQVPLTREEEEFPMAFSIAMYTDVEQTERLLRAIYQPQNYYCIHIDVKAPLLIHRTVRSIAQCFDNVWVATHLDKIKWGDVSVLLPAVNCMRDMVKFHKGKWKYFINLTGQEFPLRTNYELVRIARIFNGSNDIAGSIPRMEMARVQYKWAHRWSRTYQQTIFFQTNERHPEVPFNLTFFKGELHGLFSRRFVEFIVESEYGRRYLEWCWDTGHPTEHYWNVLNYNQHLRAPGGYTGPLDVADQYSYHPAIRVKNWLGLYGDRKCEGKTIRGICVYGLGDIPWLATRKELFANKFHLTYEYLGLDCLEERHRNRTMMKSNIPFFDEAFYKDLPTVRYSRKDGL